MQAVFIRTRQNGTRAPRVMAMDLIAVRFRSPSDVWFGLDRYGVPYGAQRGYRVGSLDLSRLSVTESAAHTKMSVSAMDTSFTRFFWSSIYLF